MNKYYTDGTISKSNIKIVEKEKSTLIAQNYIAGDFQAWYMHFNKKWID